MFQRRIPAVTWYRAFRRTLQAMEPLLQLRQSILLTQPYSNIEIYIRTLTLRTSVLNVVFRRMQLHSEVFQYVF